MITKENLQQELAKRIDGYKRGVETSTDNIIAEMKSILVLVDALPNYEKKYNEALEDMRVIYPNLKGDAKLAVEHAFPELYESEDERIRQKLMWFLQQDICPFPKEEVTQMVAYLEKQKEQEHICDSTQYEEGFKTGLEIGLRKQKPADDKSFEEWIDGWFKEHKEKAYPQITMDEKEFKNFCRGIRNMYEQKPEWSERDEKILASAMSHIADSQCFDHFHDISKDDIYAWLQSLRPQSKQEWSEEDEKIIDTIVSVLGQYIDYKAVSGTGTGYATPRYSKEIDWLKSLRPSWKPSEEQMNCLCAAVDAAIRKHNESVSGYKPARVLKSLYEDLQKL